MRQCIVRMQPSRPLPDPRAADKAPTRPHDPCGDDGPDAQTPAARDTAIPSGTPGKPNALLKFIPPLTERITFAAVQHASKISAGQHHSPLVVGSKLKAVNRLLQCDQKPVTVIRCIIEEW
jgi:hypothetical protein